MPPVSSLEKRAVARIHPVQLDLFSAPSASVGKVRAHHAVAAPVSRAAAPAASLQSGATLALSFDGRQGGASFVAAAPLFRRPCGMWRACVISASRASFVRGLLVNDAERRA